MEKGAYAVQKIIRTELEDYIKSQYLGKNALLLSALENELDEEGQLYQKPYIESSPAYKSKKNGIDDAEIKPWLKSFFHALADANLGVYPTPFIHQIEALEDFEKGYDLFVSTGTGSGKTECFMWPIMAKLVSEAKERPHSWGQRGIRTVVMYPMNALVSDQISRLRRLIGDPEHRFVNIFRSFSASDSRRPQFGMYTGRTPYPGPEPVKEKDRQLASTLERSVVKNDEDDGFFDRLVKEGRVPAKEDLGSFIHSLRSSQHIPDREDAELITRFEMQAVCPDILITNYSMLEYMLLRPREAKIWSDTKAWLDMDPTNKLLFVIDEAHMYRGSSGGEVALLIRRLFHKLGIDRSRVQFILTTASMPNSSNKDTAAVHSFACDLTAAVSDSFSYITGEKEEVPLENRYSIPDSRFDAFLIDSMESPDSQLEELNSFWRGLPGYEADHLTIESVQAWMYDHIPDYEQFCLLMKACRGQAVSIKELAETIFPEMRQEQAMHAVSVLLAIAPLARNQKGGILFPARMHMLFRGIKGIYACANPNCSHGHTDGKLHLGELVLSDGEYTCPECGSVIYELYNDRRCGSLFYRGFIMTEDDGSLPRSRTYLWRYPGQLFQRRMKEIHLYIPEDDYCLPAKQGKHKIAPCYMSLKSGFINFHDDSDADKEDIRKLYYCDYVAKGRPDLITFPTCPHCQRPLTKMQLSSFGTRGNQSFYNLIKSQFDVQPPVLGKDKDLDRLPNQGRKVLLFSDSRQRAARLARDMSDFSDEMAAKQLFALAVSRMESQTVEYPFGMIYDFFALEAGIHHVHLFHNDDREKFQEDCKRTVNLFDRTNRRRREYTPRLSINNAPNQLKEAMLRAFCGAYNTLTDAALCWIEPTDKDLLDAMDMLEDSGVQVEETEILEAFNAWLLSICTSQLAFGHTISDDVRFNVQQTFDGKYGLSAEWKFAPVFQKIMGWEKDAHNQSVWKNVFQECFMDRGQNGTGNYYVDLDRVRPRIDLNHEWYKCEKCSGITPYRFRKLCPYCSSEKIRPMTQNETEALGFWRNPVLEVLKDNQPIHVIDTEEHTAQLSYKDQRDEMWSRTEQYELRFQDLIRDNEVPVDILSSTTTMEVGIDIGSLVAVGLRNIPPMRENYQQRAGRAGRRGSSLSTIVTFCEGGPHDTLYFNDPEPMFRGDPRRPWIDIQSEKLLKRHLAMVVLQEYLATCCESMESLAVLDFFENGNDKTCASYIRQYQLPADQILMPGDVSREFMVSFKEELITEIQELRVKCKEHPELYVTQGQFQEVKKSFLDALYEESIIPTYSFPKNVVSMYITDRDGKIKYEVDRGLDVAVGEYAPGRSIVVDKATYQVGGLFYPGSERIYGHATSPARGYLEDANYYKRIKRCEECGWFGLEEDNIIACPFCGNHRLQNALPMVRPWGFAPRNGESIPAAQIEEEYTAVKQPLYSTLPESEEMTAVKGCTNIRLASRANQRIIMANSGKSDKGFTICRDCGAIVPGDDPTKLNKLNRPYFNRFARGRCRHMDTENVQLGYDFITDMLVLEFSLDESKINCHAEDNLWLERASVSLSEAFRLAVSRKLDVEFSELVTGNRKRQNDLGTFIDFYIYDNLSSGAGYAVSIADDMEEVLEETRKILSSCKCGSACYQCLKHYGNQFVHGSLDRFAALELLNWGMEARLPKNIPQTEQARLIYPLKDILENSGIELQINSNSIMGIRAGKQMELQVYPAMKIKPHKEGIVFVSDVLLKYARPIALLEIEKDYSSARVTRTQVSYSDDEWTRFAEDNYYLNDPEIMDLIHQLKKIGAPVPEYGGYEVGGKLNEVIGQIDLAWPSIKVGILKMDNLSQKEKLEELGWKLYNTREPIDIKAIY